ncbi:hypothetical protein Ancab_021294 [Ancistrocladus abbreviatus]
MGLCLTELSLKKLVDRLQKAKLFVHHAKKMVRITPADFSIFRIRIRRFSDPVQTGGVTILDAPPRHRDTGLRRTRNGEFIDGMIILEEEVAILDAVPGHRNTGPRGIRNGEFIDDGMIILEEALIDLSSSPQGHLQQLPVEMILADLKITTYIVGADQESQICTICQMEYEAEDSMATTRCGHEYHTDCIRKWLAVKNICPLCNSAVVPIS